MERPTKFGDRRVLTDAEATELERAEAGFMADASAPTDPKIKTQDLPNDCGKGFKGADCGYNFFWIESGSKVMSVNGEKRSSMIVEPANGRVPALTPERQQIMARIRRDQRDNFDGPEVRPLSERCLLTFGSISGPPMLPSLYNNNYQIVQSKDSALILVEMIHDARVVRLNATHVPQSIRKWMGDSIGHWEGETLVVETTNFTTKEFFRGATENLKITERFTRMGPHTINYRFTAEDPTAFTGPFTGEVAFNETGQPLYEYACHEGNYALPGILAGARADERAKAAAGKR
jgi:hypothetical protein